VVWSLVDQWKLVLAAMSNPWKSQC
jgi:hypothetical protein